MSAYNEIHMEGAEEVARALDKIAWATTPRGMHQVLKDAGMILRKRSMQAFRTETAPEYVGEGDGGGSQWEPLADSTATSRLFRISHRKGSKGRLVARGGKKNIAARALQDTGAGRRSISIDADASNASVAVGTAYEYMGYHQTGTGPHVIEMGTAGMLAFVGGEGQIIFAKKVNHPGFPARPFLGYDTSDIESILKMTSSHLRRAAGGNKTSMAALLA